MKKFSKISGILLALFMVVSIAPSNQFTTVAAARLLIPLI